MAKFAQIIPLIRLPRSLGFFDYIIPEKIQKELQIGMIARIPFRGKKISGIVINIQNNSNYSIKQLKEIIEIAGSEPIIDKEYLEILLEIAKTTLNSPGLFLRSVLPEIPKKIHELKIQEIKERAPDFTLPAKSAKIITKTLEEIKNNQKTFVQVDDALILKALIYRLALNANKKKEPLLILCGRRQDAANWSGWLKEHGLDNKLSLSTQGKNQKFDIWKSFQKNKLNIVVGTRNTLFLPMSKNGTYLLLDEYSDDWKQSDINPRFDARKIVQILAEKNKSKVIMFGPIPTLQTANDIFENKIIEVNSRIYENPQSNIISLQSIKTNDALSPALLEEIDNTDQPVLIFTNRKGKANILGCQECKYIFYCPNCTTPFSVYGQELNCPWCKIKKEFPQNCPSCHKTNFYMFGTGSERIEEECRQQFDGRKIVRFDKESETETPDLKNADIIIGTTFLLDLLERAEVPPKFGIIAFSDPDSILGRTDFQAAEKLSFFLSRLKNLATQTNSQLVIQTHENQLAVWKVLSDLKNEFFKSELKIRENFHYPPSWRLTKLIIQNESKEEAQKEAEEIYKKLKNTLPQNNLEIFAPCPNIRIKIRNQYHFNILIKSNNLAKIDLNEYLKDLPDNIVLDLDTSQI